MTPTARLDELAESLSQEARHAAGARADADVASKFDVMTTELNIAAEQIEELSAVVAGPSPLEFPSTFWGAIAERQEWVRQQVQRIREVAAEDPLKVRQGKLWGETQRAVKTLRNDLENAVDDAYERLLDSFRGDDRDILETLPPGIKGITDYREAIQEFEHLAESRPSTPQDVTRAASAGRELQRRREEVEAQAVPAEFADQWRLVRTVGLPLAELTDAFSSWLHERGFSASTVVRFRGR